MAARSLPGEPTLSQAPRREPYCGAVPIDFERLRRERLGRLTASLARSGADGLLLLRPSNQEYAGIRRPCVDAMRVHYEPVTVALTADGELYVWTPYPDGVPTDVPAERIRREIDLEYGAGASRLAADLRAIFGASPRLAIDEVTGPLLELTHDWMDGGDVTGPARLRKTSDEIACLREAQRINEDAIVDVQAALRPGVRQTELSAILLRRAFELGATSSCVDPIWNLTPRSRVGQTPTTNGDVGFPVATSDRFLREGDLVMCDTGLTWQGYHSDFGATWVCGDDPKPDAGLQSCFERWRAVMACVYEGVRPGRTCGDVVGEVTALEPKYKLAHFYLGHGIGCDAAEPPFVGTDRSREAEDRIELQEGMTIVFEPVIWEDGVGGYRSEELVLVTADGCERLSRHGYAPFQ